MTERPQFTINISYEEFKQHYWYKHELAEICKNHNLSTFGTKAELEDRIKLLLTGEQDTNSRVHTTTVRMKTSAKELSLETRLIPDGFKFNRQAREFFANYYNQPTFSFTKEMAAAVRDAERRGDMEMTVADLIQIYEGKKKFSNMDEKSYQWNTFVKQFSQDPRTRQYGNNRMKAAAELWSIIRERPGEKQFSKQLLDQYEQVLRKYYTD